MNVRKLMVVIAALAIFFAFYFVPLRRRTEFARLQRQMAGTLSRLKPRGPAIIDAIAWGCAHGRTVTAYEKICSSSDYVPMEEMYRLRADLADRLDGPDDFDTLVWIWGRLARTGPHGRRYVEQFGPRFLECLPPRPSGKPRALPLDVDPATP